MGSGDGVRANETVLNGQGLVGQVTSVTATTATVVLASFGRVGRRRRAGAERPARLVSGPGATASGSGLMHLQMLSSSAVLKPGDQLVTSASVKDKPYVPGVPVGVITRLVELGGSLTEGAEVRPFVDFTALGVVGVVIVPPRAQPAVRGAAAAAASRADGHRHRDRAAGHAQDRLVADAHAGRLTCARPGLLRSSSLLGIVLQLTVLNGLRLPGGGVPDLVLVLVCALAMAEGPLAGLVIGFAAGLCLDLAPPGSALIGQYALVFCLAGWAAGRLSGAAGRSALRSVVLLAGVVAAAEVLAAALARVLEPAQVTVAEVRQVLPATIAYDLVLCPFVLYLVLLASALLRTG